MCILRICARKFLNLKPLFGHEEKGQNWIALPLARDREWQHRQLYQHNIVHPLFFPHSIALSIDSCRDDDSASKSSHSLRTRMHYQHHLPGTSSRMLSRWSTTRVMLTNAGSTLGIGPAVHPSFLSTRSICGGSAKCRNSSENRRK